MLKTVILIAISSVMFACASPSSDMLNNQYNQVQATASNLTGVWSGSAGPYAVSLKFLQDGQGLYCWSWNGRNSLEKFKVVGNQIIFQSGLKQSIFSENDRQLVLRANYFGGSSTAYSPDPLLKMASPYCEQQLK